MKYCAGHGKFYRVSNSSRYLIASGFMLIVTYWLQSFTGVILTLFPNNNTGVIHTTHSLLPSVFVFFIYLHLYKNVYFRWGLGIVGYSAYITGLISFLFLLITCFTGYLIPWGQVSFWGTQVVTSFLDYIPIFGERVKHFTWGSLKIEEKITQIRFKSLHIILGIVFSVIIFFHILVVHNKKSLFAPFSSMSDNFGGSFIYPIFYLKDIFFALVVLYCISYIFSTFKDFLEESGNVLKANPLITPLHIIPEWYFLTTFSVLKYFNSAVLGIIFGLFIIFFISINLYFYKIRVFIFKLYNVIVYFKIFTIYLYISVISFIVSNWSTVHALWLGFSYLFIIFLISLGSLIWSSGFNGE